MSVAIPNTVRLVRVIGYQALRPDNTPLPGLFIEGKTWHGMTELTRDGQTLVVDLPAGFVAEFARLVNDPGPIEAGIIKASPSLIAELFA